MMTLYSIVQKEKTNSLWNLIFFDLQSCIVFYMLKQRASKSLRSHSEEQRTAVYSFSLPLLHLHRRVRSKTIKRWYSFSCTCCYSSHQCKDIDRAEEGEKSPHQCIYCQYRHICELRLLTWSYLFIRTKYKYILPISLSSSISSNEYSLLALSVFLSFLSASIFTRL